MVIRYANNKYLADKETNFCWLPSDSSINDISRRSGDIYYKFYPKYELLSNFELEYLSESLITCIFTKTI
jgi:hypothetical protein